MKLSVLLAPFPVSLSVPENLRYIDNALSRANPGDWVLFPEGAVSGYSTDIAFLQEINPQEVTAGCLHLQELAVRRGLSIFAGVCMDVEGAWFNTAQGFLADGAVLCYRKINLANHERGIFSAGDCLPVFEVGAPGEKVKIGLQLCRELRYPEQWGWLARQGAQVILHLNNAVGDDVYQPVWKSHLVSRAAETQRFILSVNNAAPRQVCPTLAIAPDGQILAEHGSDQAGWIKVELDLNRVSDWYLNQCRDDIVAVTARQASSIDSSGSLMRP